MSLSLNHHNNHCLIKTHHHQHPQIRIATQSSDPFKSSIISTNLTHRDQNLPN
ncbi:hypothetical protein Hanom_Chr04g00334851 [Helianthus anomalus]